MLPMKQTQQIEPTYHTSLPGLAFGNGRMIETLLLTSKYAIQIKSQLYLGVINDLGAQEGEEGSDYAWRIPERFPEEIRLVQDFAGGGKLGSCGCLWSGASPARGVVGHVRLEVGESVSQRVSRNMGCIFQETRVVWTLAQARGVEAGPRGAGGDVGRVRTEQCLGSTADRCRCPEDRCCGGRSSQSGHQGRQPQ